MMGAERECLDLYAAAGASVVRGATLSYLVRETMGLEPRYAIHLGSDAITRKMRVRRCLCWQILVRWGIDPPQARYLASVELARWWLDRYGAMVPTRQNISRLAAAILTPSPLFASVAEERGMDVDVLAYEFRVPKALALLRLGEVCGIPVAVTVCDGVIRVRGNSSNWRGCSDRIAVDGGIGIIARR